MVHWTNSYKFGKDKEAEILPIITEYFSRNIQHTDGQYAKYDFFDENYKYELKSRTNASHTYPDTMITCNKMSDEHHVILLFNFTNCLCYIEYNKEKFKDYRRQMFSRANEQWDEKEHLYIPVEQLTIIKSY